MRQLLSKDIKPYIPLSFDENKSITIQSHVNKLNEKKGYEDGYKKGYEDGQKEGFKKGHEEGFNKGQKEIEEKIDEVYRVIETFKNIINELTDFKEKQIKNFLPEILKLAFKIAEKVVATKISVEKDKVLSIVKEALKAVPINEEVFIKVNPDDYEFISGRINELGVDKTKLKIEPSSEINTGGCSIETRYQYIVSTIEQRFKELEDAINSVISQED